MLLIKLTCTSIFINVSYSLQGTAPVPAATIPTAWSGGGCPKAYEAAVVYEPGDVVSVGEEEPPVAAPTLPPVAAPTLPPVAERTLTAVSYTSVYECKAEPYNQFCGMVGFEPGEGQAWKEGWVEVGSCSGTLTPTTSPNYDVLEDMGGCPSEFDGSDKYEAGDQVSQDGLVYACREWPYSEHCSQDGYNPGNPTNNASNMNSVLVLFVCFVPIVIWCLQKCMHPNSIFLNLSSHSTCSFYNTATPRKSLAGCMDTHWPLQWNHHAHHLTQLRCPSRLWRMSQPMGGWQPIRSG